MFDILQDLDDGLFYVYYSGTLLEKFNLHYYAQEYVDILRTEMETYYGA